MNEIIFDYDMFGDNDLNGFINVFTDEEALKNSLGLWFSSKKGERFRAMDRGGFFISEIDKLMSDEDLRNLESRLISAVQYDYSGILEVKTLKLLPDYSRKQLNVGLTVYAKFLNQDVTFSDNFKLRF